MRDDSSHYQAYNVLCMLSSLLSEYRRLPTLHPFPALRVAWEESKAPRRVEKSNYCKDIRPPQERVGKTFLSWASSARGSS